jgi:hypothetical protein
MLILEVKLETVLFVLIGIVVDVCHYGSFFIRCLPANAHQPHESRIQRIPSVNSETAHNLRVTLVSTCQLRTETAMTWSSTNH